MIRHLGMATLALALSAGVAACSFGYQNPAERLGAGEVGGRTVDPAGGAAEGVSISLKGASLGAVSRASGRFALPALPPGRHTLLFRRGTDQVLQREVELGWGKDGQAQGQWFGDLALAPAASVSGRCAVPGGPPLASGGLVVDEVSGTSALVAPGAGGAFLLAGLAAGEHRLRAVATDAVGTIYVGGPRTLALGPSDAGTVKALAAPLELHRATAATARIVLRVQVVGDVVVPLAQLGVSGLPASARPTFDSTGLAHVDVREGRWTLGLVLPAGVAGVVLPPPVTFVAVAGDTVDLGTLYLVATAAQDRAAVACHADADCGPAGRCADGACQGFTPVAAAAATAGLCDAVSFGCTPGPVGGVVDQTSGTRGPPYGATCLDGDFAGSTAAVACGTCCTPDGLVTLCAAPGQGGCPAPAELPCSLDGFCREEPAPRRDLRGVSGSSTLDVWAAGVAGALLHWNGREWVSVGSPVLVDLNGVWSASGAAAFAVGDGGVALRFDGTGWTRDPTPTSAPLRAIAGTSAADAWAVGDGGTILRWDGALWTTVESPTAADLTGVTATRPGEAVAVGRTPSGGVVLRWNGSAWTVAGSLRGAPEGAWGTAASDLWVAEMGGPERWTGAGWDAPTFPLGGAVHGLCGTSPLDVWASANDGGLARWDGTAWSRRASGTVAHLSAIFTPAPGEVWAVGTGGVVVHLSR